MYILNSKKVKINKQLVLGLFLLAFLPFCFLGCSQEKGRPSPQDYIKESQEYYQKAIESFKNLILQAKEPDRLEFELGLAYYRHGDFQEAIEAFQKSSLQEAKKYSALSYYKSGDFTSALEIFSKEDFSDPESKYYYGMTCEKLNLFDKALGIYSDIGPGDFKKLADKRINLIEKQSGLKKIKDVDKNIYKLISLSPGEESYPQAGALILLCDEKMTITPEKTKTSELHYLIKILNERGKEDYSETHIEYDSTFEKVKLEYARTIKADGSVVDVGSRHIRDVSKYLNFPLYSNARVFIISFPEVAEGAFIEYKLKIYRSQLVNEKDFVISYPVQSSDPILQANFLLEMPQGQKAHLKNINQQYNNFGAVVSPKIKNENNKTVYAWQFSGIPQILPETSMPPAVEINPSILISTFSSWEEVYNWWYKLAKDKIKADGAIKNKVKELLKGKKLQEDKARAIYNYCAQKIRYVAVEYGQAGYEPHQASDIFRNKYGDCKDQAILLVTMLREAGFDSWPVLISTKDYYNMQDDFPSIIFNHCIASVLIQDKIIFLDPTAETCSFRDLPSADQGRKVLIFKAKNYSIADIPVFDANHNSIKQVLQIKLASDQSISAKKEIFVSGIFDQAQRYWLLYTPPQLIEESLKEKIQDVSIGAKLNNYRIDNLQNLNKEVVLSYSFWGPEYLTSAGRLKIMPQLTGVDTSIVAKEYRNYPIDLGIPDLKETDLLFELPEGLKIKYLPDNVVEDSPWLKYNVEYSCSRNKIIFKQKTEWKKDSIEISEYAAFKKFYENLAKKVKQRIILEEK